MEEFLMALVSSEIHSLTIQSRTEWGTHSIHTCTQFLLDQKKKSATASTEMCTQPCKNVHQKLKWIDKCFPMTTLSQIKSTVFIKYLSIYYYKSLAGCKLDLQFLLLNGLRVFRILFQWHRMLSLNRNFHENWSN